MITRHDTTEGHDPAPETRCGLIALVGAPNAGKSTLLNRVVGARIAIITPKAQTTRTRMTGIAISGTSQFVFIDTPGIFAPKRRLDRAMVAAAWSGIEGADLVVVLVDAHRAARTESGIDPETRLVLDGLKARNLRALLVLNKIDTLARDELLRLAQAYDDTGVVTDIFMISALTGDGVEDFMTRLEKRLPPGPWLYPEDQLTDSPLRQLAAEMTREQAFLQLHQEIPYGLTVEGEGWEEREDGSVRIDQVILVARESHKGMVLGKGGRRIKAIGAGARAALEALLDRRVHLFLYVKIRADWMERPEFYRQSGLDYGH